MRESTAILVKDLKKYGASAAFIARAEADYYHDYFSSLDCPMIALREAAIKENLLPIAANVAQGKYDGTKAESDEWARSREGRETFKELLLGFMDE